MKLGERMSNMSSGEEKRFTLRMDMELFDTITNIAKAHKRSVAKEIEYAVELYIQQVLDEDAN